MYDFSKAKILVVGDVMLDQYWSGNAKRISPEAPVPVVKVQKDELRAGGAANVALNIAALGAKASLVGIVGDDVSGRQLNDLVVDAGITPVWVYSDKGTICKLRILSHHQQLIRMDFEEEIRDECAQMVVDQVIESLPGHDVLVISDYAKGALNKVEPMIEAARAQNIPVMVDPKGQDFARYSGATLIKPNQGEFEQIVGACSSESVLVEKAETLMAKLNLQALLVTRSENGMALMQKADQPYLLKAQAQEVFDVTGAGDTVMAALATAYASQLNLKNAVHLANEAASVVVRKVGTSTVTKAELDEQLHAGMRHKGFASMSAEEVKSLVEIAQQQGEKVVMTNGCFDILHSGHVRYLNEAAKKGDRLIVAVNSDASVGRLKGETRPIVPLEGRMELLSALSCVDWVVPFEEDTPEQLICYLGPDVLVKGGDYKPEEIAGSQCVWEKGGEVAVLSFWDGFSTTNIVERIKKSLS